MAGCGRGCGQVWCRIGKWSCSCLVVVVCIFSENCPLNIRSRTLSTKMLRKSTLENYHNTHWKNKLVILTTEWLPWLQPWVGYERFFLVLETNCTRQPDRQLLWSSCNHYPTDSNHYHVREPPGCIKNMKVPYCNFEVHLHVKTPLQMFWGF